MTQLMRHFVLRGYFGAFKSTFILYELFLHTHHFNKQFILNDFNPAFLKESEIHPHGDLPPFPDRQVTQ